MSTRVVTQDDGRSPKSENCYILQHTRLDHQIKLSNVDFMINGSLYICRRYCVKICRRCIKITSKHYRGTWNSLLHFLKTSDVQFPCKFLPSLRRNCGASDSSKVIGPLVSSPTILPQSTPAIPAS